MYFYCINAMSNDHDEPGVAILHAMADSITQVIHFTATFIHSYVLLDVKLVYL